MTEVRSQPCTACPYRRDVPSGLWAEHEYDKLPPYDEETMSQPFGPFMCHATPDHYCHGWAVVHTSRGNEYDLIALRLVGSPEIPPTRVPLFASGAEAAEHGKRDITTPSPEACDTVERLTRKYPRLQHEA
jgi:Family of unknown function (DUF6283)